jgi:hypothetical protein
MNIPNGRKGFLTGGLAGMAGCAVMPGESLILVFKNEEASAPLPCREASPVAAAIPVPKPRKFLRLQEGGRFMGMISCGGQVRAEARSNREYG